MVGEILKSDIKFEDSNGRAVQLGDEIIVEMPAWEWEENYIPFNDETKVITACHKMILGTLHLRAGSGLFVKINDIVCDKEYNMDATHVPEDRKYHKLKIRKYTWYKSTEEAKNKMDKIRILRGLKE